MVLFTIHVPKGCRVALGLALLLLGSGLGCTAATERSPASQTQVTEAISPSPPAIGQPQQLPVEAEVTLAGQRFELEVARTPEQQRLGLMFRTDLPPDRGMWFPFDPPQPASFWMFNTIGEIHDKVVEYFENGSRLVWIIHPEEKYVLVYRRPEPEALKKPGDILEGGEVIPGFALDLSEFFAEPEL